MGNQVKFGGASGREPKEKLTVEAVRENLGSGVNKIVLTVAAAYFYDFPDKQQDGRRGSGRTLIVEFTEFDGFSLNCNKTQGAAFEQLMAAGHLPSDADEAGNPKWTGRAVPMFVKKTSFEENGVRTEADKWYPVPPSQYLSSIREHGKVKEAATRKKSRK